MNCPKCNQPMKEYLGLHETGWDCVNTNCGKEQTPEHMKYPYEERYNQVRHGGYPGTRPIDIKIDPKIPSWNDALEEMIKALEEAGQNVEIHDEDVDCAKLILRTYEETLYDLARIFVMNSHPDTAVGEGLERFGVQRMPGETDVDLRFRIKHGFHG